MSKIDECKNSKWVDDETHGTIRVCKFDPYKDCLNCSLFEVNISLIKNLVSWLRGMKYNE